MKIYKSILIVTSILIFQSNKVFSQKLKDKFAFQLSGGETMLFKVQEPEIRKYHVYSNLSLTPQISLKYRTFSYPKENPFFYIQNGINVGIINKYFLSEFLNNNEKTAILGINNSINVVALRDRNFPLRIVFSPNIVLNKKRIEKLNENIDLSTFNYSSGIYLRPLKNLKNLNLGYSFELRRFIEINQPSNNSQISFYRNNINLEYTF